MERVFAGIQQFRKDVFPRRRQHFEALAGGQKPELLLITCSDSRIDPALLTQTDPGDIFVVRNAGNIVPPYGDGSGAEAATVQFGIEVLGIRHVAVCGHTHCGAVAALRQPGSADALPAVKQWIEHARPSLARGVEVRAASDALTRTVAANVLTQLDHLRTHPSVAAAEARGELELHGWIYDFERGDLLVSDARGAFASIATRRSEAA